MSIKLYRVTMGKMELPLVHHGHFRDHACNNYTLPIKK